MVLYNREMNGGIFKKTGNCCLSESIFSYVKALRLVTIRRFALISHNAIFYFYTCRSLDDISSLLFRNGILMHHSFSRLFEGPACKQRAV